MILTVIAKLPGRKSQRRFFPFGRVCVLLQFVWSVMVKSWLYEVFLNFFEIFFMDKIMFLREDDKNSNSLLQTYTWHSFDHAGVTWSNLHFFWSSLHIKHHLCHEKPLEKYRKTLYNHDWTMTEWNQLKQNTDSAKGKRHTQNHKTRSIPARWHRTGHYPWCIFSGCGGCILTHIFYLNINWISALIETTY